MMAFVLNLVRVLCVIFAVATLVFASATKFDILDENIPASSITAICAVAAGILYAIYGVLLKKGVVPWIISAVFICAAIVYSIA